MLAQKQYGISALRQTKPEIHTRTPTASKNKLLVLNQIPTKNNLNTK